jgi:hypothetical protein
MSWIHHIRPLRAGKPRNPWWAPQASPARCNKTANNAGWTFGSRCIFTFWVGSQWLHYYINTINYRFLPFHLTNTKKNGRSNLRTNKTILENVRKKENLVKWPFQSQCMLSVRLIYYRFHKSFWKKKFYFICFL